MVIFKCLSDRRASALLGVSASFIAALFFGCTSSTKAKLQAREAYIAGQQQAEARVAARNSVTVLGPVRNQMVPWTEDLTLAKALIAADYAGKGTPKEIILVRNGLAQRINPNDLLAGQDIPLQQGDLVQIR
jgi:hypothetical protein